MKINQESNFQNCENLNVNLTNFIQSEAIFIGIDIDMLEVVYVSENYYEIFGYEIYNKKIDVIFSQHSIKKILNYSNKFNINNVKSRVFINLELNLRNKFVNIPSFMFYSDSILCIEFQINFDSINKEFDDVYYQEMLNYISDYTGNLNDLSYNICKYISEITGFERTYFCEFLQDGHGFVRANFTSNGLESLLYHHFPASDLPISVRKIYVKNKYRLISNVDYIKIPIKGCGKRIDLTYSIFRDISTFHIDYLRTMGLKSSASFTILIDEKFKGVIGCHSKIKNYTPIEILPKIQILVDAFSKKMVQFKYNRIKSIQQDYNLPINEFVSCYENAKCNFDFITKDNFELLKEIFKSHYIFYRFNNKFEQNLDIPSDFINEIFNQLKKSAVKNIYLFDKLININPIFEKWSKNFGAGILVINLSNDLSTFIVLLRKEQLQTIKWSGNPNYLYLLNNEKSNQKRSFNTWVEEVKLKCKPWTINDYEIASQLYSKLILARSNYLNNIQFINDINY